MAGIIRVIMRITELGGSGAADLGDLYIRPPVDGIAMLEFGLRPARPPDPGSSGALRRLS